ncbi:hypothetical protein, partial [Actinomadura sp. BRA 177]|uniref:hypothetical protein n=1 Tax=Actinomadura sp. BRA 177 TaxID=2745202 RepID=UPI001C3E319F
FFLLRRTPASVVRGPRGGSEWCIRHSGGAQLLPPRPRTPDTVRPPQNDPPSPPPLRPASEPVPVGQSAMSH